jgi:hypothetical protein
MELEREDAVGGLEQGLDRQRRTIPRLPNERLGLTDSKSGVHDLYCMKCRGRESNPHGPFGTFGF